MIFVIVVRVLQETIFFSLSAMLLVDELVTYVTAVLLEILHF